MQVWSYCPHYVVESDNEESNIQMDQEDRVDDNGDDSSYVSASFSDYSDRRSEEDFYD